MHVTKVYCLHLRVSQDDIYIEYTVYGEFRSVLKLFAYGLRKWKDKRFPYNHESKYPLNIEVTWQFNEREEAHEVDTIYN